MSRKLSKAIANFSNLRICNEFILHPNIFTVLFWSNKTNCQARGPFKITSYLNKTIIKKRSLQKPNYNIYMKI